MSEFLQFLINGLSVGSMYALIALGYTMVYGIILLINFAHGVFMMMGAFVGSLFLGYLAGRPLVLAMVVALLGAGRIAIVAARIACRPLRDTHRISVLTAASAVSVLLQNLGRALFGASSQAFPAQFPQGNLIVSEA